MKKSLFLFCFICLGINLFGQEIKRKLTIEDAVSLAAVNNISLKRQKISLDNLEKKNKYSWNSISPSLSGSGSMSVPMKENESFSYSVSAGVSLSFAPSLFTSIKAAKLNYENGKVSYEAACKNVELNVRKLFCSLIYAGENITLQKRNLETAQARYEANLAKYKKGQLSEIDLLSSQYNYESKKPTLESAIISYETNVNSFKQLLGIPQNESIEFVGKLEDFLTSGDISVEKVIDEIPSVKTVLANIESAKNQLMATRFSAWGPSLSASYTFNMSGNFESDKLDTRNSLSLSVRIPLDGYLPWSTGALSIDNQKNNLKDLELQLQNERENAELNIQNSIKKIKQSQSQLEVIKNNVQLAQKTYDMTLTAYNHGSRDLLTLQNAADSLLSARVSEQSQIYNIISAIFDLENSIGVPFGTLGKSE